MSQQNINYGTTPNDGTGDTLRNAAIKINDNFSETYQTSSLAYTQANNAASFANSTYTLANNITGVNNTQNTNISSAQSYANGAFDQANSAASFANGAFDQANSAASFANSAFTQANSAASFANGSFEQANSASSFANGAFDQANSAASFANSSFTLANSIQSYADGIYQATLSAASFANGAFTQANSAAQTIPQNAKTVDYVLTLSDSGKFIYYSGSQNTTLYIPTTANVAFSNGAVIMVVSQTSSGANVTINANSEVSLYLAGNTTSSNRNVTTYGVATLLHVKANTWFVYGTGIV